YVPTKWPSLSSLTRRPRAKLMLSSAPYSTPPSGNATGDDDDTSSTLSAGGMLVNGSTPIAENVALHLTSPSGESVRWTPQPSLTRPRSEVAHFSDRS